MENIMRIYKPTWASLSEYCRAHVGDKAPPYTRIVSEVVNSADRRNLIERSVSVLLNTQLTKKAFESWGKEFMGTSVVRSSSVQVFLWPLACIGRDWERYRSFQDLRQAHLWRSWMNSWDNHQCCEELVYSSVIVNSVICLCLWITVSLYSPWQVTYRFGNGKVWAFILGRLYKDGHESNQTYTWV